MDIRHIIAVFITSMTPVLELRGGMILAWSLKLPWFLSFTICVIGSTILGVFTFFLGELLIKILRYMIPSYIEKVEKKKEEFIRNYEKWGYIALTLFVGIPLPGTGAFTGALIAGLLELETIKTILSLLLGNVLAALLLSLFFLIR
jgi:uncharacterized membrane protein